MDISVAGGLGSLVSESSHGGVHYAVWVRLVARYACRLLGCRITTRWDDQIVLNSFDERASLCKLGSAGLYRKPKSSISGSKTRFDSVIEVIWSRV